MEETGQCVEVSGRYVNTVPVLCFACTVPVDEEKMSLLNQGEKDFKREVRRILVVLGDSLRCLMNSMANQTDKVLIFSGIS